VNEPQSSPTSWKAALAVLQLLAILLGIWLGVWLFDLVAS
jgi:hypothetical protein